jgi:hypothetical protein
MIIECCAQERTYLRFYGLLAERFCLIDRAYQVKPGRLARMLTCLSCLGCSRQPLLPAC